MKLTGERYKEIQSTQLTLKERLERDPFLPHGYYVLAETQTGGRGRGDHTWVSLEGNLHVSILLRELPFGELTWIPHWVSVCILIALQKLGVDESLIQLKWPNDLWMDSSKKIAGVMCEKKGETIIVGIGLNLLSAPEGASSLNLKMSVEVVLEKILTQLFLPTTVAEVRKTYERHMLFREGDLIQWQQGAEVKNCSGYIVGLGSHGELLVKNNGKTVSLYAEDVRAARLG